MGLRDLAFRVLHEEPVGEIDLLKEWTADAEPVASSLPIAEMKLCDLQANGGQCPRCGREWRKLHVSSRFAEYDIYQAACRCYPTCPWCHRLLMVEVEVGLKCCIYCHTNQDQGYPMCAGFETISEGQGRNTVNKTRRCTGKVIPVAGGWRCEKCDGREILHLTDKTNPVREYERPRQLVGTKSVRGGKR